MDVDGWEAIAFVEVDLASMTQTVLKQKVDRYLAYADDLAWRDRYPYCPPMLLLTTTASRAESFTRVAGQVLAKHRVAATDPAAALVVAACGHVRDPARAVIEACWTLPDASIADLTLAEILTERRQATEISEAWLYDRDVVQRRRDDIAFLSKIGYGGLLAGWLDSQRAADVLLVLIGARPEVFLDSEPSLARQVLEWFDRRRRIERFTAIELAKAFVPALAARYDEIWREQADRLLAASEHLATEHPRLCRLVATLAARKLAGPKDIAILDEPPTETRAQIQARLLGDYLVRRAAGVGQELSRLSPRERRHASRQQMEDAHDDQHLIVCDMCALAYPLPGGDAPVASRCTCCTGTLIDWADRGSIVSLRSHLQALADSIGVAVANR